MADHRLDGASSLEPAPLARLHAALAPGCQLHTGVAQLLRVPFVALVAIGIPGLPADQALDLVKGTLEGVAVKRVRLKSKLEHILSQT